ncbi:MAG: efflux RND transporter permease subunit [Acidobacteria bacterium]|nr:efflux RND transporter permease subunit [Acidobacteriota bacterium]
MKLPEFSVRRPVTVTMLFLALLLLGAVSYFQLPVDLLPKIDPPAISIITVYPGTNATDVENDVTKVLEDELSSVNNLDKLISTSKDNISIITCKFNWGVNLDVASSDVRDKIDLAKRELPKDIDEPMIFKFNSAMAPVLVMTMTARESYPQLNRLAKDVVADNLKKVPGVGAVIIEGNRKRQINVEFDPEKLAEYHLTPLDLIKRIKEENLNLPLGSIKTGISEYELRLPARFKSAKEIGNTPVTVFNGKPVYIRDVATVTDGFKEEIGRGYADGDKSLVMYVQKQSGANTVKVVEAVERKLAEVKKRLPSDVGIQPIINTKDSIKNMISNLRTSLLYGGLLVILVTFLFLGSFRSSLIVSLTIPFSLIMAIAAMFLLGYTINVISLMSLVIAIGMVVDNAIVIVENTMKKLEKGARFREKAAINGASEMGMAISASTLTTVIVFLPMIFTTGITKIIFGQLAVIVTVTLLASLFTSLSLTPMLNSRFLSMPGEGRHRFQDMVDRFYTKVEDAYGRLLGKGVGHPWRTVLIAIVIFVAVLFLVPMVGTQFLPEADNGELSINIELNQKVRLEESARIAKKVMDLYAKLVPEREHAYVFAGRTEKGAGNALGFEEGTYIIQSGAKLVDKTKRKRSAKEIANVMRNALKKIPGIEKLSVSAMSAYQKIFFSSQGKPVSLELYGDDLSKLGKIAGDIQKIMEKVPGLVDVTTTVEKPRPEIWLQLDRSKLALAGLSAADVARILRASFYGYKASKFRDSGKDFDIFVRLKPEFRTRYNDLQRIKIPTPNGGTITLADLVTFKDRGGPVKIERINRERVVKVEASLFHTSLGQATKLLKKRLARYNMPPGYYYKFGGDVEEQVKAFKTLTLLLILGIILVYMVMAAQFESLKQPFIIMFSIPFTFTGVILAFVLTRTPLSLISFIGVVMLMGIVVNNAIVLIDYVNLLRARGRKLVDAVVEAGHSRLRPVLMTTITTIGGTVPMAVSRAQGAEMWNQLGITVIGGLTVSTLITLVLVPTVYYLFERKKEAVS